MNFEWFKTEHHRLHVIEEWPDSPHKQAAMAAIRSKLASLTSGMPPNSKPLVCDLCMNHRGPSVVVTLPLAPVLLNSAGLAA